MSPKVNKGIILINLGSPDSTKVSDVRKYLNQFLMDERVIDKPWLLRTLLVRGIIVPFRAPKSAEAYEKIWIKEGSPLIVYTEQLKDALEQKMEYPVEICMRYGNPTPEVAFNALLKREPSIKEVIVLPLYPHYAMSSYETAVEWVKSFYRKTKYPFELSFIAPFYNDAYYIRALSESIKPYLTTPYDQLLFSYHGIPERHIRKSDITGCHCLQTEDCCEVESPAHQYCYRHQVRTTTNLVTEQLNIPADKYGISFQSRLGKGWLTPFTDFRLKELPAEGVKNLLIICPAFVSDCLETLEEIAMRGKEIFLEAGGESFTMIPCLNIQPLWVEAIEQYINAVDTKP
jgi:ferrochelatase